MTLQNNLLSLFDDEHGGGRASYERGPMNYIGCKFSGLGQLLSHLPVCSKWIDVFGGSGVVTLNRPRSKFEVYNDKHSGLVAFYKVLGMDGGPQALKERVELMPHSRELFYDYLKSWAGVSDDLERAARWYYLVQASVVGRCQQFGRDLKGINTVSRKLSTNIPLFPMIHDRFKHVLIENLDWRVCLRDFDSPDAVFYLDPPYWESDIYECRMSKEDHIEMCGAIFKLQGFVALSGYSNPVYDSFPWDGVHQIIMDDSVGSGNKKDNERVEWLWIKEAHV